MRLQSIEEVKNFRDAVSEVYVTAELSDIRLGSTVGEMALDGREYKLSQGAVYRMCRILGVPYSFAMALSERMPDIWRELSSRITSESNKQVTFKVERDSSKVIGLFPARDDYVSIQMFLSITEMLYKKISGFPGITNMLVDIDDESSSAFFYTPREFSPIQTNGSDLFRYGIGFSASSLEYYSPSISESLFRLICSNMTYAPSHGGVTFRNRDHGRILNTAHFVLREHDRISRYPQILSSLIEKRLSYGEVEHACSYVDKLRDSGGERLVPDLERRIPLSRIARAYGYENLDAVPNSPSWKSSARTPITPYEVFNHLTQIGSHYTHIPEKERLNVLINAGHLMFKESWDLEELAPQEVDFSNWKAEAIQVMQ